KLENLLRIWRAGGEFDACVDILRVFAEDDHINVFRMLKGRGDAFEVLHRSQENEKIEELPQRNVERTNAPAYRRGQRTFDSHVIFAERFYRVVWQPFTEFVLCCLARENLEPRDLFSAAVRFFDCSIEYAHARGPDVGPGSVSADKRNDRLIRDI